MTATLGYPRLAVRWPAALGDTLLLRVNPVAGVRLARPDLRDNIAALEAAQIRMDELRDTACAEIYALAAPLTGKARHVALALKRAIYNGRDPGAAASRDWPDAVRAWVRAHGKASTTAAQIREAYSDTLTDERTVLADAIGDPAFLRGLSLTAPQVLDAVQRYREVGPETSARARKSERGILQYLTRAMVRTSPLSWFTAAGFAVWSPTGAQLDDPSLPLASARSFVTVDRVLFAGMVTGLVRPDATIVTFNPSLSATAERVRFQQLEQDKVRLVETPVTPQLRAILEFTAIGPLPAADLAGALAGRLDTTVADAHRVIAAALAAQILMPGPAIDEQAADPVPLARHVLGADHPADASLAALERELTTIATAPLAARTEALHRVDKLQDRLNEQSTHPARLHLNEDVMLPTSTVSAHGYRQSLHDLAGVLELASVFETNLMLRCLLGDVFVRRYGVGGNVGLIDCAETLSREVAERARRLALAGAQEYDNPAWPVQELLETRERARAILVDAIRARRNDEELWLPSDAFRELAAALPERLRNRPASYGILVQPHGGRLMFNGCYGGRNLLGMRFLGPAAALDSEAPPSLGTPLDERVAARVRRLYGDDGVRLLEDHQLHNSNINHRIRLLDDVIAPREWIGLRLRHDPLTNDIDVVDSDGTPVRILYLGMRWIETLPPPLRIAMWLADTGQVAFDPIGWAHRPDAGTRGETPVRYPRLVAGAVVVGRRRWYPGADFPVADGSDDAGYLLDVTRWRARHGVPDEVLVKSAPEPTAIVDPAAALAWYQRVRRRGKPQYVDLASAAMVRVLPRVLERRGTGYLEEALPGVRDGRHAFEWIVEYDRPSGGRFEANRP